MKAEEIRTTNFGPANSDTKAVMAVLVEIAAQLAEINERLTKPPIVLPADSPYQLLQNSLIPEEHTVSTSRTFTSMGEPNAK